MRLVYNASIENLKGFDVKNAIKSLKTCFLSTALLSDRVVDLS